MSNARPDPAAMRRAESHGEAGPTPVVVFVCEHGAAKSIVAAAWMRRMAADAGLPIRVVARGTDPAAELSSEAVNGLLHDGIAPVEQAPQAVHREDSMAAWRVVSFGPELPADAAVSGVSLELWAVPAISDGYESARDAIVERLKGLLEEARAASAKPDHSSRATPD